MRRRPHRHLRRVKTKYGRRVRVINPNIIRSKARRTSYSLNKLSKSLSKNMTQIKAELNKPMAQQLISQAKGREEVQRRLADLQRSINYFNGISQKSSEQQKVAKTEVELWNSYMNSLKAKAAAKEVINKSNSLKTDLHNKYGIKLDDLEIPEFPREKISPTRGF